MEKYINADHQNLAVWCRRAGVELVEPEKRLAVLGQHFGTGRRAVLRMLGVKLVKSEFGDTVKASVGWVAGHAIGDLVYTMAYTEEAVGNQVSWLARYTAEHCKDDVNAAANVMLKADFICKEASRIFAARQAEYDKPTAGASLANAIIRKARGY